MSTFSELAAYVTDTEWNWMYGVTVNSKITEIDITRPNVYLYGDRVFSYTNQYNTILIERGSLATLQTDSAQAALNNHGHQCRHVFTLRFMEQSLAVIQYYVQFFLNKHYITSKVWDAAILCGRRDVLSWMKTNYNYGS